ncbi:MAG: PIG-L deacetylase family protein [Actinomycetota bacterium]
MHLLGVYAHPDDETYTVGGSLARAVEAGFGATILTFTRGEAGGITPGSGATRETLGEVREAELREACRILGCTDVRIVGTPDGGTAATEHGVAAIADVIAEVRPEVVVTMEPEGITRHPDHRAVSEMTLAAVQASSDIVKRLYFAAVPTSMYERWNEAAGGQVEDPDDPLAVRPVPDDTIACLVDIGELLKRKIEALWAHKTQSQEFVASQPADVVELALRLEAFQRIVPPHTIGEPVSADLFEGLG